MVGFPSFSLRGALPLIGLMRYDHKALSDFVQRRFSVKGGPITS